MSITDDIHILVIEDDESLNYIIQKRLKRHDYNITGVFNGNDALTFINENNYIFLILIDYKLPDIKTEDLIKKFQNTDKDIYYIIITGYTDINNAINMMKMGALDYFIKDPNFLDLLPSKLEKIIQDIKKNQILQQSQYEIIKSEQKFRSIFEASPMGMLMYELNNDDNLILIDANKSSENLLKLKLKKSIGSKAEDIFPGLTNGNIIKNFKQTIHKGTFFHLDNVYYKDKKIDGYFEFYAFRSSYKKLVVSFLDITDRKLAEITVKRHTQNLELLHNIIISGNKAKNVLTLLKYTLDSCIKLLNYECGCIYLINHEPSQANLECSHNLSIASPVLPDIINIYDKPYAGIFFDTTTLTIKDYKKNNIITNNSNIKSLTSIPLLANNRVIGMLTLITVEQPHNLNDEEKKLLKAIGNETGTIIAKMQSEEALLKKTRYLETSNEVLNLLKTSQTQIGLAKLIKNLMNLQTCIIGLINKNKIAFIKDIASDIPKKVVNFIKNNSFDITTLPLFPTLMENGNRPVTLEKSKILDIFNQYKSLPNEIRNLLESVKNGDALVVPLITSNSSETKNIGYITLVKKQGHSFNLDEKQLVQNLAFKIASTLEIHNLAYYDDLTGLPNIKMLKNNIAGLTLKKKKFSLFILNINKFSKVIASRGDEIGDKSILEMSNRLLDISKNINEKTILFRPSHDKAAFAILVPIVNKEKNIELAENIITLFSESFSVSGIYIDLSVNIGIYEMTTPAPPHVIIKYCKTALFESNKIGPNSYSIYTKSMTDIIQNQLILEKNIREALNKKLFFPHYQPKVDIYGNITGYEALSRWLQGTRTIYPKDFIQKIEEMGFINKLFYLILEKACEDINKYKDIIPEVSINLSPRQFQEKTLISNVEHILNKHNIAPIKIKLELIETALIDKKNIDVISKFREKGIRIAIDDFGTGHAKYETLLQLFKERIIDEVKIAKDFVDDLDSYENTIFITSICQMTEKFNVNIVIEGVENFSQFLILKGISQKLAIQGWLFSKALPAEEAFMMNDDIFRNKITLLSQSFHNFD